MCTNNQCFRAKKKEKNILIFDLKINIFNEAVQMCTHNQCFRAKKKKEKNILIFDLKINILTAVKYCYILHGCVCVMLIKGTNCASAKIMHN